MGDVNCERARREAAETVGNQRPSTGAATKAKPAAAEPEQGTEEPGEGESKSS